MNIDRKIEKRLKEMFPGVILDNDIEEMLHIRTENWQITSDDFCALLQMDLEVDHIYTEGNGFISLVMTKESNKKVTRK